jgi:hypothetical protein
LVLIELPALKTLRRGPEVSGRRPEVCARKPEVSTRKPEVCGSGPEVCGSKPEACVARTLIGMAKQWSTHSIKWLLLS